MGGGLRKPVKSIVVKRQPGKLFRVGFAEMNGWRQSMEDAHIIFSQDAWGFFGVFDGHGGSQCSSFVAKRMTEEIAKGAPEDDAAVRSLVLQLDQEFLDLQQPSGTTGTFAIVHPDSETEAPGRFRLRIGNIGDSRVLLGRADGTIVEGPGTDGGLTTDHKPDHPVERARIERTGGHVQFVQGVPRVNGDLAVSRAFGDEPHKKTGPSLEEQPVSADPEFTHFTCDSTDFLMLVCDGISEGTFPNKEVVQLAAEELRKGGERPDPGAAAAAVCRKALDEGSMDNLSCMIVLFGGGELPGPEMELIPGPFIKDTNFVKAYAAMGEHAGLTLAAQLEMRYDLLKQQLQDEKAPALADLQEENKAFGDGPPTDMPPRSAERINWFNAWIQQNCQDEDGDQSLEEMMRGPLAPQLLEMARSRGMILPQGQEEDDMTARCVRIAPVDEVRAAFQECESLREAWSDKHAELCGRQGHLLREDNSDGTAEVVFDEANSKSIKCWFPISTLTDVKLQVSSIEELKPAVEKHSALKWHDRLADTCLKFGVLLKADSDGTSHLRFPELEGMTVWLPSACLHDPHEAATEAEESADGSATKRQRTAA